MKGKAKLLGIALALVALALPVAAQGEWPPKPNLEPAKNLALYIAGLLWFIGGLVTVGLVIYKLVTGHILAASGAGMLAGRGHAEKVEAILLIIGTVALWLAPPWVIKLLADMGILPAWWRDLIDGMFRALWSGEALKGITGG
jgi:hypothetical protein